MGWTRPIIAVLVGLAVSSILARLIMEGVYAMDFEGGSMPQYFLLLLSQLLLCGVCLIECLVALHITDQKEKLIVWGLTMYTFLGLLLLGVLLVIFEGYGYFLHVAAAFLCLLIPRYVLKHGEDLNKKILGKMEELASEIED